MFARTKILDSVPDPSMRTEDGKTGLFDVKPFLESGSFAPLKDGGEFERIHNGKYFIEWHCGADLSADTIQARWEPVLEVNTQQQGAPVDARISRS